MHTPGYSYPIVLHQIGVMYMIDIDYLIMIGIVSMYIIADLITRYPL